MSLPADPTTPESAAAPRIPKSQSAFRTISEVAEELDVAQHVLRFWETKFAQVRPLKRGGGRRYYRPEDVELLRQIRALLYDEGYTIKGAQKLLRARRARGAAEQAQPAQASLEVAAPAPSAPTTARGAAQELRRRLAPILDELIELRDRLQLARR